MKLDDKIGSVSISSGIKVTNFRIKVNKHSFKQLYSGLYSDKIHAIVRELSTNAFDSHISAGKPEVPFEVHIPSELEPFFYVKDFGTGLSPEQIAGENGIYITFFESDKSHSDDFTGCLGLGSKSPFAYTDNFMVESRYNGKLYSFACFHNEAGEPCIAQMGECDTNEPNGLKVEFAVKQADFYEFHGKAEEVLSWFKVKPIVVGKEFKFKEIEYLRKTERYGIRKMREGHSVVVMGNVAYDVQANDFAYNKLSDVERQVIEWGVDLFLDIGAVEFVPSREKLAMTDKTIKGIRQHLGDVIKSLQEELGVQVVNQPTIWKARRMLHDIKHSILGKVRSMTTVVYNGKEISEYISLNKIYDKAPEGTIKPKFEAFSLRRENYKRSDENTIYCDGTKIYYNDLEHGGYARISHDLHLNGINKAYCVSGATKEFLEETGIGEAMIRTSSLPKTERIKRERTEAEKAFAKRTVLQEYVPNGGPYAGNWWRDVSIDIAAGGVYVEVSYGNIVEGESKQYTAQGIKHMYDVIKVLNPNFKLLAIRPSHLEKMEKYKTKWIKFKDYINILLKEKNALAESALAYLQYGTCDDKDHYESFYEFTFESHSLFGEFIEMLKVAKAQTANVEAVAFAELNGYAKEKCELLTKKRGLEQIRKKVEAAYPLITVLDWWRKTDTFLEYVFDYVKAMDDRRLDGVINLPAVVEAEQMEAV